MFSLTSLFSGTLVGVFGSIGSEVLNFFKEKQKHKHDLEILDKQKELAIVAANNLVVLETIKLLASSYENDRAHYSVEHLSYVDQIRGLVRPVLTTYLTLIATGIAIHCVTKIGWGTILMDRVSEYTVYATFELLGTCVGWYFGSRGFKTWIKR